MRPQIVIIGCGKIARKHCKSLEGRADLYFFSQNIQSAESLNKEFNGSGVFRTFEELCRSAKIEIGFICSPPKAHTEQILSLWKSGKSVVCEKPLCVSQDELDRIEEATKAVVSPRQFLMIAENYYYKPSLLWMQKQISDGRIGRVKSVSVRKALTQGSRTWKSEMGALIEGGVHFVSLLNDLATLQAAGNPLLQSADFPNHVGTKSERTAKLKLEYTNGVQGELFYSWETPSLTKGLFQRCVIEGETGRIVFENNGLGEILFTKGMPRIKLHLQDIGGQEAMIEDLLQAAISRTTPYSNFSRAKRDLRLIFDAYAQLPGTNLENERGASRRHA